MELDRLRLRWRCEPSAIRLAAGLRAAGFETLPSAGTYFLNATFGDADAMQVCQALPHEAGVAAIPLSAFSDRPALSSIVRFAFCKREEVLDEAIERLRKWKGG